MLRFRKRSVFTLAFAINLTALLIFPLSLSSQISSFSLSLDLDGSKGDQAVTSLSVPDPSAQKNISVQIFGSDIQNADSLSTRFEYDTTQIVYEGFDTGDVLSNAQTFLDQDPPFVQINLASLSGSAIVNSGLIGTLRFRTTNAFSGTKIRLVRSELDRGGQREIGVRTIGVVVQVLRGPSPDFDRSGVVDFPDFLFFVSAFGSRLNDGKYETKYDLDGNGEIAFEDFLIFVSNFGKAMDRRATKSVTSISNVVSVCDRSPRVRDAIVAAVSGVSACGDVTADHLATITRLSMRFRNISTLKVGDFSGLSALTALDLSLNQLTTLESGIFSGLSALETLGLWDNQLTTLEAGVFSGLSALTVLNVSRNRLTTLEAGVFSGLSALTRLSLSRNQLTTLEAGVFSDLPALRKIDLSKNQFSTLESGVFSDLPALRELDLGNNKLTTLKAGVFSGLTALSRLALHDNQLTTLESGVFSGLSALTQLILVRNRLSTLETGVFSGLTALQTLSLHNNAVDPLPITISLELVEAGQFKAKAHTGAPFNMVLPIRVVNGTLVDGKDNITISTGSVTSDLQTVSRTPGTIASVAVDIGELPAPPGLPTNLSGGYALVKSQDLPIEVLPQIPDHPFLIVTADMFAELRSRADREPWATWKQQAIDFNREYDKSKGYFGKTVDMRLIVSNAALAYILDEGNRPVYVRRIVNAITTGWPDLVKDMKNQWGKAVPPGSAFFNSVLAADVIYYAMSDAQRRRVRNALRRVGMLFRGNTISNWKLNLYGSRLVWELFEGNVANSNQAKDDYIRELKKQITEDGAFISGTVYAAGRLGGDSRRYAKTHTIDVLEFTNKASLYSDPQLIAFYEWFYGYSVTPFRKSYSFGDSSPEKMIATNDRAISIHKFSQKAAQYAVWHVGNEPPASGLLAYVLMDRALPMSEVPPSRVFSNGGAFFREAVNSPEALAGALHNVKKSSGHTHKEVNAIHLAAYGEHILRNAGYNGYAKGALGFNFRYINQTAHSANVVSVDTQDHAKKTGGGIEEYLIGEKFDYARGNSGTALRNARHYRNFCLVHSTDNVNGYFILFDEIDRDTNTRLADLYIHPNSDDPITESIKERYKWRIGSFHTRTLDRDRSNNNLDVRLTQNNVHVTVYLATEPQSVEIKNGLLAANERSFIGKYLHAKYAATSDTSFVTLIFPHDNTHDRPIASRLSGDYYTGAQIRHTLNDTDYVATATSEENFTIGGRQAQGKALWFRANAEGEVQSVFLKDGKLFASERFGINADNKVSLLFEGQAGQIISPGTEIWIRSYLRRFNVVSNGMTLPVLQSAGDSVKVNFSSGKHKFELVPSG